MPKTSTQLTLVYPWLAAGWLAAAACPAASGQSLEYSLENGVGNINTGPGTTPPSGQVLWGNVFTAQPGAERITSISVAFGTAIAGTRVRVVLLDDPNDDGVPSDGVLLTSQEVTIANPRSNVLNNYPIQPTVVSGRFFAGVLMDYTAADRPARQSTTSPNQGWSWLYVAPMIDLRNPAASPIIRNQTAIPGTWLIRCTGEANAPVRCSLADVAADGVVDGADFVAFINSFGTGDAITDPLADVNADGTIDGTDFVAFINAFGEGC